MATIHELSSLVALPELDLFGVPPTQLMVSGDVQTEHRPISTISNNSSPIDFEIHSAYDEYINLGKSELYMCIRINLKKASTEKDPDVKLADWKKIAPVNYLMNTMFKNVKVEIGKTNVTTSTLNYAYVSYLDALLNYPYDAKNTHLESAFWHKDNTGKMDEINEERSIRIRPLGSNLNEGCEIEMYGNLHLDLGSQVKSLLGGVTLNISLLLNDPKFYLMFDKSLSPHVEILDARFYIHRSKISPQVVIAHNRALEHGNSRYFITRKEVKSFIIQKGTIDCYLNNVENGILPRKVYVGLISNEAFNGSATLNPFNFKNYSLRHIACYLDGCQYPQKPYTPDYDANKFIREYFSLFETANQLRVSPSLYITREEFKNGFNIYGFNFSPDLSDGCTRSGYVSELKTGNLRIEIRFGKNLPETVSAIIFCEYDNLIEVSTSRIAIKNFN
jgi:hypothetical protein